MSIPNKELMDKFADMLMKETSLGYVYSLARESTRMLNATLHGDTETMCQILEKVHNTEIPLLSYNNETELTAVVNLVYLAARDRYRVEREDKAGIGYVDFIFYPETDKSADAIILELKVNHTQTKPSARFDLVHGASLSAVWESWALYVYQEKPERFVRYARKCHGT